MVMIKFTYGLPVALLVGAFLVVWTGLSKSGEYLGVNLSESE
jgi:hypothetical protein